MFVRLYVAVSVLCTPDDIGFFFTYCVFTFFRYCSNSYSVTSLVLVLVCVCVHASVRVGVCICVCGCVCVCVCVL